jgi:hypothetical protein
MFRDLQKKLEQITTELRLVRQNKREEDKIITKLQNQLTKALRKYEVSELFRPKRIEVCSLYL